MQETEPEVGEDLFRQALELVDRALDELRPLRVLAGRRAIGSAGSNAALATGTSDSSMNGRTMKACLPSSICDLTKL